MLQGLLWVGVQLVLHSTMTSLTPWGLPDVLCHMENHDALSHLREILPEIHFWGDLQEIVIVAFNVTTLSH